MKDIRKFWDEMARFGPDRSVIEPNDSRGDKIRYITYVRDWNIIAALGDTVKPSLILDLGCGSGNLSKSLVDKGYRVAGVDISSNLLNYVKRHNLQKNAIFILYDGQCLPFALNSFDACVTYESLMYMADNGAFNKCLENIFGVLKPGGKLITIEQTCRKGRLIPAKMKRQRSEDEVLQSLARVGFKYVQTRVIRRGHFPLIYLIRYGIVRPFLFPYVRHAESLLWKVLGQPYFDYANTVFIAKKPSDAE